VYLVHQWSVLAPPVFVCVLAGGFVPRASSRGARATLPFYQRNSLNVGFLLTLACALAMVVGSAPDGPAA
jgi:hypothetical protein